MCYTMGMDLNMYRVLKWVWDSREGHCLFLEWLQKWLWKCLILLLSYLFANLRCHWQIDFPHSSRQQLNLYACCQDGRRLKLLWRDFSVQDSMSFTCIAAERDILLQNYFRILKKYRWGKGLSACFRVSSTCFNGGVLFDHQTYRFFSDQQDFWGCGSRLFKAILLSMWMTGPNGGKGIYWTSFRESLYLKLTWRWMVVFHWSSLDPWPRGCTNLVSGWCTTFRNCRLKDISWTFCQRFLWNRKLI